MRDPARTIRFSDADWREVCRRAKRARVTPSEYIRRAALADGADRPSRVAELEGALDEIGPRLVDLARRAAQARGK